MSEAAFFAKPDARSSARWVALLGRRDTPTDGVEDYCIFLARGLSATGVELRQVRVPWAEIGWIAALRELSRESSAWRGEWVLVQFTAFSWSRRGFPFPVLLVLALLRRSGARVAVVFHESCHQGGVRWIDRLRNACQDWVIRRIYQSAAKSIFTVPLETIAWLPKKESAATFIPIGANIPESVGRRDAPGLEGQEKTVIVFGITGAPNAAREIVEIAAVMREASHILGAMRLVVVGRGSVEAREQLAVALAGCDVKLFVKGILPADEIAREFENADALLFVRGAITSQRGSALAGIACGLPIVGYQNGYIGGPLKEAGVEWSQWDDRDGLTRGLIRVLSDPAHWTELHERNIEAQQNHFSWRRIAAGFQAVLTQ